MTSSALKFTEYPGPGEYNQKTYRYSQAVRIGPVIKCSGQGGWDDEGKLATGDVKEQIRLAFKNLEKCIVEAGGKGWSQVYAIRSWHTNLDDSFPLIVEQ